MTSTQTHGVRLATMAGVIALGASGAIAGVADPIVSFGASNNDGSGAFDVNLADAQFNDGNLIVWTLVGGPITIQDGGNTIATITSAQLTINNAADTTGRVNISLSYNVIASDTWDTDFSISSGVLDGFSMAEAAARATGTYSFTDGGLNGATLTGNHAGGGLYNSYLNAPAPGMGTSYTELFNGGPFNVGASGSDGDMQDNPTTLGEFAPVGAVSSIATQWDFSITAGDLAGGTSNFIVIEIPTPAGASVLAIGGLFASRRRR